MISSLMAEIQWYIDECENIKFDLEMIRLLQ